MTSRSSAVQTLFDNLSTAVLVFDENLRLAIVNTAAESLLSMSARKVSGQTPAQILPLTPQFAEAVSRALETGHAFTEWGMELQLLEGRLVVDCMIAPVLDGRKAARSA
ncbi:MAG: PAS domain-containing protein [Gammaproteobacteria bacterium]|nr:PAS domain-containing protein [Gammaproteobacteria bacterium]